MMMWCFKQRLWSPAISWVTLSELDNYRSPSFLLNEMGTIPISSRFVL